MRPKINQQVKLVYLEKKLAALLQILVANCIPCSLHVCLLDEYSSEEKCEAQAVECYTTYRKEKCVATIRSCLSEHSSDHSECLGVAESCLYEGEEGTGLTVHHDCLHQIPLCLPSNTEVS